MMKINTLSKVSITLLVIFSLFLIIGFVKTIHNYAFNINSKENTINNNFFYINYSIDRSFSICSFGKNEFKITKVENNKIYFNSIIYTFCDPNSNIKVKLTNITSSKIEILIIYNGKATRCICPYKITGFLEIKRNINNIELVVYLKDSIKREIARLKIK